MDLISNPKGTCKIRWIRIRLYAQGYPFRGAKSRILISLIKLQPSKVIINL